VTIARRPAWRALLCALLCTAFLAALATAVGAAVRTPASTVKAGTVKAGTAKAGTVKAGTPKASATASTSGAAPVRHVVIVGISGLRWAQVTPANAPALWHLAQEGSVGDLVDYAQQPLACPADGWLTLNSGARAAAPVPCGAEPAVVPDGKGARIPQMPGIVAGNRQFDESPDWGLLGGFGGCATAVGPGAALALATAAGAVPAYLPAPSAVTAAVLARCPLTVIDLGTSTSPQRSLAPPLDATLGHISAELPPDTRLLVTAPGGTPGGRPHLELTVVTGPGYTGGLLHSTSTRQPGIVTLTDLTTTVTGWLGRPTPSYAVGARITSGARGSLAGVVGGLVGRDAAEQVWIGTHVWFFVVYALADVVLLGLPALLWRGPDERPRRRRARWWRVAGTFAAAVPAGTFLANLVPWWSFARPAVWLYATAVVAALIVGGLTLAVTRQSDRGSAGRWPRPVCLTGGVGTFGIICLFTLTVLGVDVMTGSRLQLEVPFGLSLTTSGRYYGIGNAALGVYCVSALGAAAWAGGLLGERWAAADRLGNDRPGRGTAVACASAVALFAVVASGWPGFGAKVGGTIAMVPCFLVLLLALGGARVRWGRLAVPVAASGVALFAVLALASYFAPALGVSDMGAFAGNLLHGQGGALLERKVSSNVGTLTVSYLSPVVPVLVVAAGLALWRPSWFRLRSLEIIFSRRPLLRLSVWLMWLVLVFGWLADDSGVIVPATALPFAVPVIIGMCSPVSPGADQAAQYRGNAFAGPSVAGQNPR
jgi:hypothetical protein